MENFFLGLEFLYEKGFWLGWEKTKLPKWENGFLQIPCSNALCSRSTKEVLKELGFSWSDTGMLQFPIEQGRLIVMG